MDLTMIKRWQWVLRRITRRLWFRASLFSLLGVATAFLGLLLKQYIPDEVSARVGADAVDNILEILASSMLAATTFSLNIMVSAYASATTNVTPRATPLLLEDRTTQNALATFIGSFLFSLVGIIALSTSLYGKNGRVVMFAVTIVVIALIVYTLLRWIDHLAHLGRLGETTDRVEAAAIAALKQRMKRPYLGGHALPQAGRPVHARAVCSAEVGYIQHIDVPALGKLSDKPGSAVYVEVLPGSFVDEHSVLAYAERLDDSATESLRAAFSIGTQRSFEQDPRFGLSVLAEIASRALSPAVNDPGTAIDVIGRAVRVLSLWNGRSEVQEAPIPECRRVFAPLLDVNDMFDDIFGPIARDGAGIVEVGVRLQKALCLLGRGSDPAFAAAVVKHSELAVKRAELALNLEEDKQALRELASKTQQCALRPPGRS
ncbi:DUF2254 domain-containing protein [Caballeronia sp. LZ032]|uniref:DUF2254 domain-containing protein n=1 Tax=Caballeronia sp. LZ032 TaxID=3038565 RepID=UPI00286723B8|nr:DUF2254 domain-containing protein [Caballeronia sp. LZ032]MDR5880444.1 DUF2254 domain-containing protein [Caballeronia sp. LZ032]